MRVAMSIGVVMLAALVAVLRPHAATHPKLAVLIVVDQMRADYVDRFRSDWTAGLKRLVSRGAWFNRAAYPYFDTFTCPGHATIGTGAFPSRHGVFQNSWFDRGLNRAITCTEDAAVQPVSYDTPVPGGESAAKLLIPTFADEMRRQRSARVVSLSLKARSAIMMAGHGGDAVTWLSDSLEGWKTSTAYSQAPVPEVAAFIRGNPITADYGKTWSPILPSDRHEGSDAGLGERPPLGWTDSFPHVLNGDPKEAKPTRAFYVQWETSPYADAYVGRMAAALAESLALGSKGTTDVLAISFSSPDLVGHAFGPRSWEVREMYADLDRTMGSLFDRLDQLVGADQYVVGLSADHGVSEIPEQLVAKGRDGGRVDIGATVQKMEAAAQAALGPGRYLQTVVGNDVYFVQGAFEKLLKADALVRVIRAGESAPGVARVLRVDQAATGASGDRLLHAVALGSTPNRRGELILALKPGWIGGGIGATHGSANPDDQRVPVMLYGAGIKPGRYDDAATPADIAPTLADICGIDLPQAQGTILRAARQPLKQ